MVFTFEHDKFLLEADFVSGQRDPNRSVVYSMKLRLKISRGNFREKRYSLTKFSSNMLVAQLLGFVKRAVFRKMRSSVQLSPSKHLENINKMFKKLYNDEQLADVTLCCKDGTIKAHKLILATSSPYFHKIFTENQREHLILIMHGVSYSHLHCLIELMYKGNVDVLPEDVNALYELAGEFQLSGISGILREEGEKSSDANLKNESSSHGRDTRFKGLKRVAVDYKDTDGQSENEKCPVKKPEGIRDIFTTEKKGGQTKWKVVILAPKQKTDENNEKCECMCFGNQVAITSTSLGCRIINGDDLPKLSAWAKKQRKFKCDLCPSSFKRSSHLTRHQLVHTGERPFACEHCDKAFSRHDKLKHHIRKTHEGDYDIDYTQELQHISTTPPPASPLPFIISHVRSEAEDEIVTSNPPKRPRGRPRKYPPVEKPLVKRRRGRPRLNPIKQGTNGGNYDITNLPYGDLEYLTMPLQESALMEPYVEIKTERDDANEEKNRTDQEKGKTDEFVKHEESVASPANLKVLEHRIAEIGECTISVADH